MMTRIVIYTIMLMIFIHPVSGMDTPNFTRNSLLKYLTNESIYDAYYPPGYDTGNIISVAVQFDIFDITKVDEQNMAYEMMIYLRMNWTDGRLAYRSIANYSRLELTGGKVESIWRPDLYFPRERQAETHGIIQNEELIYIFPEGGLFFSARFSLTNHCYMDLTRYPFDEQICDVTMHSYAFDADKIMLRWYEHGVLLDDINLPNYGVAIGDTTSGTIVLKEGSMIRGNFSYVQFNLKFHRKSGAYSEMYFFPYIVFVAIAMTSFGFNSDKLAPTRFIVCVTCLTNIVLQWIAVYSRLPPVRYRTHLDLWISIHISAIGLILVYHTVWFKYFHEVQMGISGSRLTVYAGPQLSPQFPPKKLPSSRIFPSAPKTCVSNESRNTMDMIAFLIIGGSYCFFLAIYLPFWSGENNYVFAILPAVAFAIWPTYKLIDCLCKKRKSETSETTPFMGSSDASNATRSVPAEEYGAIQANVSD